MLNIRHRINQVRYYIEKYGFFRTIKKCFLVLIRKAICILKGKKDINYGDYGDWIRANELKDNEIEMQRKKKFKFMPKISIVVPMYNTKENFLNELVNSVINQTYSNFELCLCDGSPIQNEKFKKIISSDERIKYKFLNKNYGISGNTNEAIEMVTGDYIALLDHDDTLAPYALYEVVKTINKFRDVEFIYSDEDKIDNNGNRYDAYFKPDFAPDTLRCQNYICHFSVFKKEVMDKLKRI